MVKIQRSIDIDAPVEKVFAFFTDPSNFPEIWPSMVEVSNVQRGDDGPRAFDWVYKMLGLRFHGHSETVELRPNQRVVTKGEGGIVSTFVYEYEEVDGKTRLTMDCEYEIPQSLLGRLAEPIIRRLNEREADAVMSNLKDRMELAQEARAGEAAPPPEAQPPAS